MLRSHFLGGFRSHKLFRNFIVGISAALSVPVPLLWSQEPIAMSERPDRTAIASDLEMIYAKTETASTLAEYSSIYDFCRNISGDSTRAVEDRRYARTLMSWAANRRGEVRSDQAGTLAQSQNFAEAERLDALAKKDFESAIELDSTRWRAHHNLGIVYAVQGNHKAAIDSFSNVIKLNPEYTNAYFNRAEVFARTKQHAEAISDFNKLIKLKSDDSAAFSARAHALFAAGKTSEALTDYRKAMELAPVSADAATEYADTCQSLGQWKEAAQAYQVAMKLDGNNARTLQNAAWMMATCPDEFYRNGESALQTASRAVQAASATSNAQALDVLAAAQAAAGDFASAQGTMSEALQLVTDQTLRAEMQMRARLYARTKAYVQPKR